jgi:hypothetical protein
MVEVALYALLTLLSAAAVGFLAYWVRGRVLEQRLAILDAIAELGQRVAQLEHSIHAADVAPLERKLDGLADKLKNLDRRLAVLGTSRVTAPSEGASAAGLEPRQAVEDSLERRGFQSVKIVSESSSESGPAEFRVEAIRNGVAVKGSVFVHQGVVAETRLTPVYELFP